MDSLSFESFHAQLDCKFTYGNKNQTQLTLVQYIQFRVQEKKYRKKQQKTVMMKNITRLVSVKVIHDM